MPDPTIEVCTKGQWTKVATNVSNGGMDMIEKRPMYFQTYRVTGTLAPDPVTDAEEKIPIFVGTGFEPIQAQEQVDVYIWITGRVDGKIRVNV